MFGGKGRERLPLPSLVCAGCGRRKDAVKERWPVVRVLARESKYPGTVPYQATDYPVTLGNTHRYIHFVENLGLQLSGPEFERYLGI